LLNQDVAHRGITPNNLCVTTYDILKEPFTPKTRWWTAARKLTFPYFSTFSP